MPAISEVIMGTRSAAPDDLAPLGMTCCGLRGAWTDVETYIADHAKTLSSESPGFGYFGW